MGVLASLSKEIGITVFGVFGVIEVLENYPSISHAEGKRSGWERLWRGVWTTLTSAWSWVRLGAACVVLTVFLWKRLELHGAHSLYTWTVLENHIHLLPTWEERALSYAQTHFWYVFKLLYPRYLCFDYGYACIPTIHTLWDWRNLLPLAAYAGVAGVCVHAVSSASPALLLGLAIYLLALIPALNILFPVGTVLAERLLYVPSIGFCLVLAHGLADTLSPVFTVIGRDVLHAYNALLSLRRPLAATESSAKRSTGRDPVLSARVLAVCVAPVLLAFTVRVVSRVHDWQSETEIYGSALHVCPHSVKALNNYAVMSFATGSYAEQLARIEHSIDLYPAHSHAYLNAGVASARLGKVMKAIYFYQRAVEIAELVDAHKQGNGKAFGYQAQLLYEISTQLQEQVSGVSEIDGRPFSLRPKQRMQEIAAKTFEAAFQHGFDAPSVLHSRASLAIDTEDYSLAVDMLTYALRRTLEVKRNKDLPRQDLVQEALAYNQLGVAYSSLRRIDEAIAAFTSGLEHDPHSCELLSNVGDLYREKNQPMMAKQCFERCLQSIHQGRARWTTAPPALLNNLGLLELDSLGNPVAAHAYFVQAQTAAQRNPATTASTLSIIQKNLMRTQVLLGQETGSVAGE